MYEAYIYQATFCKHHSNNTSNCLQPDFIEVLSSPLLSLSKRDFSIQGYPPLNPLLPSLKASESRSKGEVSQALQNKKGVRFKPTLWMNVE